MRITIIGRLLAMLLLLGGMLAVPVLDAPFTAVMADEDKDESGQNEDDDKNEGKDEKKDKKDKNNGKKDKDDKNDNGPAIAVGEDYTVEVECDYDEDSDTTTCTFTGIAPDGAKDVSHVDMPEEAVCAEVVGGDHEYVDPDPNTRVTGYKSKGSEGTFTLEMEGEVTAGGTTTYWFKTGDGVFPATGPGLVCGEMAAEGKAAFDTTEATAEPTAEFELQTTPAETEATGETGELLVDIYMCSDVPEDTTGYDWFGMCDPEGGVHQFELTPVSEVAVDPQTAESDASGDVTFTDLEAGMYRLEMTDATWCKAVSDNVDAESNVIIEAGERTTVYGFVCEGAPAS